MSCAQPPATLWSKDVCAEPQNPPSPFSFHTQALVVLGLSQREKIKGKIPTPSLCLLPRSQAGLEPSGHQISGQVKGGGGRWSSVGAAGDALGIWKAVCVSPDPKPIC